MVRAFFALLLLACFCYAETSAPPPIVEELQKLSLNPAHCYRVRDLYFIREDLKIYFTDGYLIFGKPVHGRILTAVFTAEIEGGDAELLLFPPTRSERLSLAQFTNSPNLNEHLHAAVFVFTDATGSELLEAVRDSKRVPEIASTLASDWESVARNLAISFGVRLVQDLYNPLSKEDGFFFGAIKGRNIGNFDVLYEPRAREQIVVGQVASRDNRVYFDIWTSFQARSWRNGRKQLASNPVRLSDFRIDAAMEPKLHLKATTRMKLKPLSPLGRALGFDLSRRMKITAARIDGQPAEFFSRDSLRANLLRSGDNELFLLINSQPFEPGREYELEFDHEGDVVSEAGNGVYFVGARGDWYPNRGSDFASYDVTFRYPAGLTLVASGDVVEQRVEGEQRIVRRRTAVPIRFAAFNLGDYQKAIASKAGVQVEVYANRKLEAALQPRRSELLIPPPTPPSMRNRRITEVPVSLPPTPPDPMARVRELASEVANSVEFFSGLLGPPPLTQLTVSPIPGAFGQGFPGLIYLSTLSYLHAEQRPAAFRNTMQRVFYSELLHAHEAAHQWWGNLISSASHQDHWLMESLASYCALLYLEKRKGRKALDSVLSDYRDHLLAKTSADRTVESVGPIIWGTRLTTSHAPEAWRVITYEKGSWILHMLRVRLGDERFFAMLRELVKRYSFKSLNTQQFHSLASEFAPKNLPDPKLENFFEQWVYGTGIPDLKLAYVVTGKAPALSAKVSLTQNGVDERFSVLIPIQVQSAGTRSAVRWVETSSSPVAFTIPLKQGKPMLDTSLILTQNR